MIKFKFLNALTIALILFQAVLPIPALAMSNTAAQRDYTPGSVVTINGDNSDGFVASENVHVEASSPNGTALACDSTTDENGAWSCDLTVPSDGSAAGEYSYTATGETSGVFKSGSFTVTVPTSPTVEPTQEPTQEPTIEPTSQPTAEPTTQPTESPTAEPTSQPTEAPTTEPTLEPTASPTVEPSPTASLTPVLPPFIESDKEDYAPAEIVTLTSGNWQPGEWVVVFVNDNVGQTWSIMTNQQADENGTFSYEFNLPNWFVATYEVIATGEVSGIATSNFTDANLQSVSLNAPTSVTVAPGGNAGYTVNVGLGGNSDLCTVTLSITTSLPAGANATFTGGTNPFTTNANFSRTLTISTTSATPAGSYSFIVQAAKGSNCQGSTQTATGTLVVVKRVGTVTVGAQTGTFTYGTGSNATYLVTVNRNGSTGGGTSFNATLGLINALPAGASATFTPPSLSFTNTDTSKTSTLTITTSSITPAGSTSFTVQATNSALSGDNSTADGTLTVGKKTVTASVSASNKTYDGTDTASIATCSLSGVLAGDAANVACTASGATFDTASAGNGKTVNATGITLSGTKAGNYQLSSTTATTTANIDKKPVSITATSNSKVFGDSDPALATTNSGFLAGDLGAGKITFSASRAPGEDVASYTITPAASDNGTGLLNNYQVTLDNGTFTISQAISTTVLTCPTNVTYNGSAQTPCTVSVTGVGGLNLSPTPNYANNVNAGLASATYTYAGDLNHSGSNASKNFTIDQAPSTTVVTCDAGPFTYTGSAIEVCSVAVTGAGGLSLTPDPVYTDNIDAGTATASYTFDGDSNHTGSSGSDTFEIAQASSSVTVTCPASKVYTGSAIAPCSASYSTEDGLSGSLTVSYTANTNAGTAHASANYAGDANHSANSNSATFEITKAASSVVVDCPISQVYTGLPIQACTASYTTEDGLSGSLIVGYTANTNVGTATATADYAGDGNHQASSGSDSFEITKAESSVVVDCPVSEVYTGSPIETCTASFSTQDGLTGSLPVSYSANINVGTATATADYAGDGNHQASSGSDTFQITKAASIITVTCPTSQVYTGSEITPCSAEATGVGMDPVDVSDSLTYSSNINVGTATANASWDGDPNHFGNTGSATFEITKAASVVTVTCPVSRVYTGSEIAPCSAEATGAGMSPVNVSNSLVYTDNINVGTAHANAGWAGDDNHFENSGSATFEITKASSTTVVTVSNAIFDGSPHGGSASVSGAGDLLQNLPITYAGRNATTYGPSTTAPTAAGDYTASASFAGDANHDGSNDSKEFSIDQAESVTTVVVSDTTYNGLPQGGTASVTGAGGLDENLIVSYEGRDGTAYGPSTTAPTNAGAYIASATYPGDANHQGSLDSKNFTIAKANATIDVTPYDVTYDGSAHTATGTAKGVQDEDLSSLLNLTGTIHTNAGNYADDPWSFAGNENYNAASGTIDDNIDQATAAITVEGYIGIYDGEPHGATGIAKGVNDVDLTSGLDLGASFTNVPGGTANWTFEGGTNYKDASGSVQIVINKTNATIVITPYHVTYDDNAHTASGTARGVKDEALSGLDLSGTTHTNAGDYPTDAWTFIDVTGNYNNASGTVHDEISKANAEIVVNEYTVTYDGLAHTASGTATGLNDEDLSSLLDLSGTTHTAAGTYNGDAWSFAGNGNYNSTGGTVDDNISKANAVIVVTPYDVNYDGDPHAATGSATGVQGESLSGLDLSGTTHTNAGSYNDGWTFTDTTGNYNDASGSVIDKIATINATISVTPYDVVYDGNEHTATGTATGVKGEDLSSLLDLSGTIHTNANAYNDDPWSFAGDGNYNTTSGTVDDNITKADATIHVTPYDVTYNGNSQAATGTASGVGGEDLSDLLDLSGTTHTDAGIYADDPWSFAGNGNYNATSGIVDDNIDKANAIISVTGFIGVYDGLAHGATGSATGVESTPANLTSLLHLGASFTDVPGGTANWTFDGNNNYNPTSGSVAINIGKADAHITVNGYSGIYDGAPHGASGTASGVEVIAADLSGLLHLGDSFTNVPGGTAHWIFDGNNNYNEASGTAAIEITKANAVINVTPYGVTYDGNSHNATGSAKGVLGEDLAGLDLSATAHTNAGSFTDTWTFTDVTGNYNDDSGTVNDSIGKADAICSVNGYDVTYDGSAHTATGSCTGVGGPSDILSGLNLSDTTHTNAGSYTDTWTFTDATGNYNNQSHTVSDKIAKATPVITWSDPADIVYNAALGATHLNATASVSGSFVYTPADGTVLNAGMGQTLHVDFTPTDTANYNNASKNVSINVLRASSTTVVSCPTNVTYSGSAQIPCTATVTGAGGFNESLTVNYGDNTNAGTANASASFAGDANHNGSGDTKTFTIDKAASMATVTCPVSVTYTGAALTPCSANVTGAGGLNQSLTVGYSNNTNAGTANAGASFAGDANHLGSNGSATFTIDKAASTTVVTCPTSVTYNAAAQTPCTASVTGTGGLNQSLGVSYSNNTNAGTANASASFAGDANHTGSNGSATFAINKAASTTVVTCPATVYFTGAALTPCSAVVTGVGGLNQPVTITYSNNINVGTASATATFSGDANHLGSTDTKIFTIGAWTLKGFYQPIDMNGVFNTIKSGSTVPVKFEVFSGTTEFTDVGAIKSITYGSTSCMVSAPTDEIETTATGGTALRYDSTSGQFIYNWKTSGTAGTCYRLTLTTDDGSTLMAYFKLK